MHPILFRLGEGTSGADASAGFEVHTYGALGALGFILVTVIALVRARKLGVKPERVADLILVTAVAALLGSRAVYLMQNPEHVTNAWSWVDLRAGGLVFYGAMLVGLPVGSLLMRLFGMPFFAMWDVFATGMPLAHAMARVGCFAAGCCYGAPSALPWAVTFHDPRSAAPLHEALHPTQLYEAAWLLIVGIAVNVFYRYKRFDGQVMLLYLMLYAAGRSTIEVFRGDAERGWFLPEVLGEVLTWSQGISALIAAGALAVFLVGARRAASAAPASGQGPGEAAERRG